MKQYHALSAFIAILVSVSLACIGGTPEPTPVPPTPVSTQALLQPLPPATPSGGNGSGFITVEDQNKLYLFDVPADWSYEANDLGNAIYSDVYMFADTWTSPDGSAVIEGISGRSEGFNFDGSTSTGVALDLLNSYYSSTGAEGDIRISKTSTAKDGSTRFDWASKGGDYSGISWFEVRGTRTFLMWTVDWANTADQATLDMLDNAINTYQVQTQ